MLHRRSIHLWPSLPLRLASFPWMPPPPSCMLSSSAATAASTPDDSGCEPSSLRPGLDSTSAAAIFVRFRRRWGRRRRRSQVCLPKRLEQRLEQAAVGSMVHHAHLNLNWFGFHELTQTGSRSDRPRVLSAFWHKLCALSPHAGSNRLTLDQQYMYVYFIFYKCGNLDQSEIRRKKKGQVKSGFRWESQSEVRV